MPVVRKQKSPKRLPRRKRADTVGESRRRDIVEHAIRLMEEKGFAAMSVQHVADALEFSKANFYHHVDSKEKLLYEIFVETLQYSLGRLDEILNGDDAVPDRFRALIAFYVSMMAERRAVMLVWFKERAHLAPAHLAEVSRLEQQIAATLEKFYASGIAEGYFKPIDTDILRMAVFGMCFQLTKSPRDLNRGSIATITRQLQELATTGILKATDQPRTNDGSRGTR